MSDVAFYVAVSFLAPTVREGQGTPEALLMVCATHTLIPHPRRSEVPFETLITSQGCNRVAPCAEAW